MPPRRPVRTLIADQSKAFSTVVKSWIDNRPELDWVGTVDSGPEAISTVERIAPDLVLLDAVLPELDGFRVVRELKRLPRPPLAVIVTFQAGDGARRAALDAGADGFLAKDEFAEGLDLLLPRLLEGLAALPVEPGLHTGPVDSVSPGAAGRSDVG